MFKREYILDSVKKINELSERCIWIARSSALPVESQINSTNIVWTSGVKTWKSLAQRGIWVNGTADGMGENFDNNIDNLTTNLWIKLTHQSAPKTKIQDVICTYILKELPLDADITNKKFFYWKYT